MSRNAYSVKKNPHVWEKMQIEGAIHLRSHQGGRKREAAQALLKQREYYTQQRLVVYKR